METGDESKSLHFPVPFKSDEKRKKNEFKKKQNMLYRRDPIERFIDENKALIRRMYGEFQTSGPAESPSRRRKRADSEFFMDSLDIEDNIFGERWAAQSANKTKRQTDSLPNDQKDDPNKYVSYDEQCMK